MTSLVVNEVYGPVWQGEGPSTGVRCAVIRLMGCNLACAWHLPDGSVTGCDEAQTWDATRYDLHANGTRMDAAVIADKALSYGAPLVIVTGGEPLLHQGQPGWTELLGHLGGSGVRVEVETNGTVVPDGHPAVSQYNVSPKLASSGQGQAAIRPEAIRALIRTGRAVFKFVVTGPGDVAEAAGMCDVWGVPWDRRWVMPAGITPAAILETGAAVAGPAASGGFNLTLRQQWLIHPEGEPRV